MMRRSGVPTRVRISSANNLDDVTMRRALKYYRMGMAISSRWLAQEVMEWMRNTPSAWARPDDRVKEIWTSNTVKTVRGRLILHRISLISGERQRMLEGYRLEWRVSLPSVGKVTKSTIQV